MTKNILSKIYFKDRQEKLKKRIKCENTCNITFITHYYPKAEILQRLIRKYWYLIKNDPTIGTKFKKKVTLISLCSRNRGRVTSTDIGPEFRPLRLVW